MAGLKASHQLDGAPRPVLWSAERKVDGRYLSAWLGDTAENRDACTLALPLG